MVVNDIVAAGLISSHFLNAQYYEWENVPDSVCNYYHFRSPLRQPGKEIGNEGLLL